MDARTYGSEASKKIGRKARALMVAGATMALTCGVATSVAPASAAPLPYQHVGVLYSSKIYHYADSFGEIRHYVCAQGKTIVANWARPGVWSDQGLSYAGVTSYGVTGR
ncbi:hypothetical protein SAMN04515680_0264 [Leifsonia sp. 21MFCrub1.1]|nr:hypothetical protein SAMN04515680_0264 [Leifsonia sp. 21MFCrub1.1]